METLSPLHFDEIVHIRDRVVPCHRYASHVFYAFFLYVLRKEVRREGGASVSSQTHWSAKKFIRNFDLLQYFSQLKTFGPHWINADKLCESIYHRKYVFILLSVLSKEHIY